MKIRFMYLFSLCLYVFTWTADLNYNPHFLKKGLSCNCLILGYDD